MVQRLVDHPEQASRSVCGGVTRRGTLHGGTAAGGLAGSSGRLAGGSGRRRRDGGCNVDNEVVIGSDSHRFVSLVCESLSQALLLKLSNPRVT